MAIEALLDSLDGLDEGLKKLYKAGEGELAGKFVLDVSPAGGVELANTAALRKALETERSNGKKAREALKTFDGLDAAAAKDALEKLKSLGDMSLDDKVKEGIAQREKQLLEKFAKDKSELEKQVERIASQLEDELVTGKLRESLEKHGGNGTILLPHLRRFARMRKTENDRYVAKVVDEEDRERISTKPGSSDAMSIEELVLEFKSNPVFQVAFKGSGASGSNANSSGSAGGGKGNQGGGGKSGLGYRQTEDGTYILDDMDAVAEKGFATSS